MYIVSIHSVSLVLVSVHKYSCRLVLQLAVFLNPEFRDRPSGVTPQTPQCGGPPGLGAQNSGKNFFTQQFACTLGLLSSLWLCIVYRHGPEWSTQFISVILLGYLLYWKRWRHRPNCCQMTSFDFSSVLLLSCYIFCKLLNVVDLLSCIC